MIFKYCVWPDASKDDTNGKVLINGNDSPSPIVVKPLSGRKIAEGLLGCCPCAFRCRRAIGVEAKDAGNGVSTIESNGRDKREANGEPTPIALRLMSGSVDTMYDDGGFFLGGGWVG